MVPPPSKRSEQSSHRGTLSSSVVNWVVASSPHEAQRSSPSCCDVLIVSPALQVPSTSWSNLRRSPFLLSRVLGYSTLYQPVSRRWCNLLQPDWDEQVHNGQPHSAKSP